MSELPPNHHADYPQFAGVFGYLAGLTMTIGRGRDARLVVELASLTADDRVIDVGCGPGTAVRIAARTAGHVTGVDPSEPMLRLARLFTRIRRLQGEVGDADITAEESKQLGHGVFNTELCARLPDYPKGSQDQDILRYIHPQFYPDMQIDYDNELAFRNL